MIKYKVGFWKNEITKVEATSETEHFVTIEWRKQKKISVDYNCFFDTFEQAKQHVIKKINDNIDANTRTITSKERQNALLANDLIAAELLEEAK